MHPFCMHNLDTTLSTQMKSRVRVSVTVYCYISAECYRKLAYVSNCLLLHQHQTLHQHLMLHETRVYQ